MQPNQMNALFAYLFPWLVRRSMGVFPGEGPGGAGRRIGIFPGEGGGVREPRMGIFPGEGGGPREPVMGIFPGEGGGVREPRMGIFPGEGGGVRPVGGAGLPPDLAPFAGGNASVVDPNAAPGYTGGIADWNARLGVFPGEGGGSRVIPEDIISALQRRQ